MKTMLPIRRSIAPILSGAALILGGAALLLLASCSQAGSPITSTRYALIFGVEDYPGTSSDLVWSKDDADSMAGLLNSEGWHVSEKIDSDATKDRIKAAILSLATVASDSTILVYYSGHGADITPEWGSDFYPTYSGAYICPYDSLGSDGYVSVSSAANFISPTELGSWLSQTGTKNVIVILDSCYSGAFVDPGSAIDGAPQKYGNGKGDGGTKASAFSKAFSNFGPLLVANAKASGEKTPIVISAAGSQESSLEMDDLRHGVFTYYLLQAKTYADSDADGVVTTTEAYSYTADKVYAYCLKNGFDKQYDSDSRGYFDFYPHISGGTRDLVLFTD
jgi:hypothetical protein